VQLSRDSGAFFNPRHALERDVLVLLCRAGLVSPKADVLDAFSGCGVRSLRLCCEVDPSLISRVTANDHDTSAVSLIRTNARMNSIGTSRLSIRRSDVHALLGESRLYDLIDLDVRGAAGITVLCIVIISHPPTHHTALRVCSFVHQCCGGRTAPSWCSQCDVVRYARLDIEHSSLHRKVGQCTLDRLRCEQGSSASYRSPQAAHCCCYAWLLD
jgi:hypothetical protein